MPERPGEWLHRSGERILLPEGIEEQDEQRLEVGDRQPADRPARRLPSWTQRRGYSHVAMRRAALGRGAVGGGSGVVVTAVMDPVDGWGSRVGPGEPQLSYVGWCSRRSGAARSRSRPRPSRPGPARRGVVVIRTVGLRRRPVLDLVVVGLVGRVGQRMTGRDRPA